MKILAFCSLLAIYHTGCLVSGTIIVPRLNGLCYYSLGDVNIALLQEVSEVGSEQLCSEDLASEWKPQYVESFKFAIDEINKDEKILPNITVGYVIMDICNRDVTALSRSLSFIAEKGNTEIKRPPRNSAEGGQTIKCGEEIIHFDIIGVVGPDTSREAVMVAGLLSLFEIPVLSTYASSDELTDKTRFEYFMRLVPPDRFQAQAMTEILEYYGWSYISLLYSEGSYGENGAKQVEKEAKKRGICIEYMKKIPQDDDSEAYDTIINNLLEKDKARVVILFVDEVQGPKLFTALDERHVTDYFIWISSDALKGEKFGPAANGMFSMLYTMGMHESFANYYQHLIPQNSSGNPWMPKLWEIYYNCEWNNGTVPCEEFENVPRVEQEVTTWASKQYDGAWVYAYALHALIENSCPEAFENVSILDTCFHGKALLSYMKNVTFDGMSGKIKFDDNGDMTGEYDLYQYVYDDATNSDEILTIGKWDKSTGKLRLKETELRWHMFSTSPRDDAKINGIPESVCSKPCGDKEYKTQKELLCCWECMSCRENEIIVNKSRCKVCPENTWPDEQTVTICQKIPPKYMKFGDTIPIGLLVLACLGIAGQIAVTIVFYKHRDLKLVKASSRELTSIISVGILTGYCTVFAFISKPTTILCYVSHIGFNLSVTLIYAPLLLKTSRVYRIFASGKKGTKALRFIGSSSLLAMTAILVFVQVALIIITGITVPPEARLRMQVPTEKHVELFCDLPLEELLIPLAYNLALIILCAVCGFLTRKLPENFNESWYIFISVLTTTFLWIVFLPTYFTTFYAYHQDALLAFCLILNASITLLCLYVPKIYAIYFVDENQLKFIGTKGTHMGTGLNTSTSENSLVVNRSNQIVPISS